MKAFVKVVFFLLLYVSIVYSDNCKASVLYLNGDTKKDSLKENIVDLSGKLGLHFYGIRKTTELSFIDKAAKKSLIYTPNSSLNFGVGFNYKWMGLGLAFNFRFVNNDDWKYGKSSRLNLNMNIYGKKSVVDFTFFLYESFYLKNHRDNFPSWQAGDPNYIRPDMSFASVGLSYTYIFNHERFSYKAAFVSNAIQLHSAGSFFLGGQFLLSEAAADSSFFPTGTYFEKYPEIVDIGSSSIGLTMGYAYNFIIKKNFFISLSLALSPSLGKVYFKTSGDSINTAPAFAGPVLPRIAFGYNTLKYYAGISINGKFSVIKPMGDNSLTVNYGYSRFRFYVGRHFNVGKGRRD